MDSVIVQRPARPGAVPESWALGPGDVVSFGREGADIPLEHPAVPRMAGTIAAAEDFWLLSNLASERTYVVENPHGGGEFVKVGPGRARAPIPFEFGRLVIPVADGHEELLVLAPEHDVVPPPPPAGGDPTAVGFSLDREARYFRVLVALCEPQLREPSSAAVPSDAAIAERLAGAFDGAEDLTPKAVGFHVGYLAEHKLRVREREPGVDGQAEGRLEHTREAVVSLALRFDLVRPEDLRTLPAPATT